MEMVQLNAVELPSYRLTRSIERGVHDNPILVLWGGMGDQVAALPTAKYMLDRMSKRGYTVHLGTNYPELGHGLGFTSIVNLNEVKSFPEYFIIPLGIKPDTFVWEYMQHGTMHAVDWASMCAIKMQLPIKDRIIPLVEPELTPAQYERLMSLLQGNKVLVHAGGGWLSKTFPLQWWQTICDGIVAQGKTVVLIGSSTAVAGRGYVPVVARDGYIDLRDSLTLTEFIWVLLRAKTLITNDSAPYHIACAGNADIGYFSTVKHPDLLNHYRLTTSGDVVHGWRITDLARGGAYERAEEFFTNFSVANATPSDLARWLPSPEEVLNWLICRERY